MATPLHDEGIWNGEVSSADYAGAGEKYQNAILEQYKVYVEMADRISARRALSNTFFLALNTSVLTLLGAIRFTESTTTSSPNGVSHTL